MFLPLYFTAIGLVVIGGTRLYFWILREPTPKPVPAYVRPVSRPRPTIAADTDGFSLRPRPYAPRSTYPYA